MFQRFWPATLLSLGLLILATAAIFAPFTIFALVLGVSLLGIFWRWPFIGVYAVLAAAALSEGGRLSLGGVSFLVLDVVAASVLGLWFCQKLILKKRFQFGILEGSLSFFWLLALLSLLLNAKELSGAELQFAFLGWVRFVALSGIFLVVRDLAQGQLQRQKIFQSLLLVGVFLALAGFVLLQIFPDFAAAGLTELGFDPHLNRLTGTFLDPNLMAGALVLFLSLLGGKFLSAQRFRQQIFWLILAGVLLLAFFLTLSRSGLLALATAGFILGMLQNRKLLLGLIGIVVLAGLSIPHLQNRLLEFQQSLTALSEESPHVLDPTAELRVKSWQEGLRIWQGSPFFGTGFGSYKFRQSFVGEDSHAATGSDASLITVLAGTGVVGLLSFLFFWGCLAWELFKHRKQAAGALAALGGIFVHAIFVNTLFFAPLVVFILVTGGVASRD